MDKIHLKKEINQYDCIRFCQIDKLNKSLDQTNICTSKELTTEYMGEMSKKNQFSLKLEERKEKWQQMISTLKQPDLNVEKGACIYCKA
jgi:hypothetical protein